MSGGPQTYTDGLGSGPLDHREASERPIPLQGESSERATPDCAAELRGEGSEMQTYVTRITYT